MSAENPRRVLRLPRAVAAVVLAAAAVSARTAQEPPASAPASQPESRPSDPEPSPAFPIHGYFDLRYRYRSVPGDWRDQDLFGTFGADAHFADPGRRGTRVRVSGSFIWDLDEFHEPGSPFHGLSDTFDERLHGYLYEAYGELDPGAPLRSLRIGRQVLWREEGIRFDGVHAVAGDEGGTEFALYGGVPVHFFESSRDGDWVAGAGVAARPVRGLRVALDEIWIRDHRDLPGVPSVEGDLLSVLSVEARLESRLALRGSFSALGARERRQTLQASFFDPASRFRANVRVLRQNDYAEIPVTEFSPFVSALGVYRPYAQWQVDAGKPLFEPLDLGVGYVRRRLIEGADEDLFNHEFDQGYLVATLAPFPTERTSVSLRADGWNGEGRDFVTFGAAAEARLGERREWRTQVGTDYALYRVDLLTGDERFRDRQWYARVRWRTPTNLDLGLGCRYERDDLDRYVVADVSCGVRF